jgi:tetratricopeptide (TPR) repeat protein/tRNA A-37 threonylcarbamoyl transferase component Bud32
MSGFEHLLIGRTVGRHYRIEEVLGDGGFGVVFRAADLRPGRAERAVAVKVLKVPVRAPEEEVERLRARFRREASYAARLPTHPGIVPIYDYGTDPELGRDYIVMELLEGEDLRTRLARPEPVPLAQALRILRDAARALAVGHQEGLVHRDVKPGNLFLAHPEDGGAEPEVRVLDFGIAKPLHLDPDHTATHVTVDGRAPLSARYAAPEQLRPDVPVTCATDVFALGVVGFELLTRTRLFTDADQNRRDAGLAVPLPSVRARNAQVPAEVEELLFRALADDPARRFPDAGAFARAMQQACARLRIGLDPAARGGFRTGGPTVLVEERTAPGVAERRAEPLPPPPRRRRVRLPSVRVPRIPFPAVRRRAVAAALVAGVVLAGGAVALEVAGGPGPAPAAAPPEAPRRPPAAEARDANREGLRHFREREYGEALDAFRRAGRLNPDEPEYRNNEGYALYRLGRTREAVAVLEEVVQRHPERYVAYANLADAQLARGDTAAAAATLERLLGLDPPATRRRLAEAMLERIRPREPEPWPAMPLERVRPDVELATGWDVEVAEVEVVDLEAAEHP